MLIKAMIAATTATAPNIIMKIGPIGPVQPVQPIQPVQPASLRAAMIELLSSDQAAARAWLTTKAELPDSRIHMRGSSTRSGEKERPLLSGIRPRLEQVK